MSRNISPLSDVDSRAEIGENVEIGPFCTIGPDVVLGDGCRLTSHVAIVGRTRIGNHNRFFPGAVIGGDPQDVSYRESTTSVEIGDENIFREGVTVNRAAEKEDHTTRIGNRNFLMANAHVAHNCHVRNNSILCNGVLLGGHVHIHDGAIVSGNSVVHHFSTLGTLSFVSGGCRVPQDIPPYMLAAGSDNPEIVTINVVGLRRKGFSDASIRAVKQAHRLLYREHQKVEAVRAALRAEMDGTLPPELEVLLEFVEATHRGKHGRAREAFRNSPAPAPGAETRRAA